VNAPSDAWATIERQERRLGIEGWGKTFPEELHFPLSREIMLALPQQFRS
jgi:hypothetical protein